MKRKRKEKQLSLMRGLGIGCLLILFYSCTNTSDFPIIKQGKVSLTPEILATNKSHTLRGEWLFYWKQIPIDSAGQFNSALLTSKEYIPLFPSSWKKINHPSKGYGTFRLLLTKTQETPNLTLKIPRIESAAKVWVNGEPVASLGKFSTVESESTSDGRGLYIPLPKDEDLDIIITVSNYHHVKGGGFSYGAILGETNSILRKKEILKIIEAATSLIIICISLYHLILLFFSKKQYFILYFGLLCFTASIRQLFVGEVIIYDFFPNISFYTVQLFRYLPVHLSIIFFTVYYKHLLPEEGNKWVDRAIMFLAFLCLIYSFSDTYETTMLSYVNANLSFISIFYTGIITWNGLRNKRELALPIFVSTYMAFAFLLNDILYIQKIIQTAFLVNYGIIIFLLMQSIINYKMNKKIQQEYEELTQKVNKLESEIIHKKEEVTNLLTESIQELQMKKELTNKLAEINRETKNHSLSKVLAELKSKRLENSRVLILKQHVEELNYGFIKAMKTQHPLITNIDIEICSLIRIGLSSNEIARLRGTSKFSVKSSRYRIRKKLNLKDDVRLSDYLKSFSIPDNSEKVE